MYVLIYIFKGTLRSLCIHTITFEPSLASPSPPPRFTYVRSKALGKNKVKQEIAPVCMKERGECGLNCLCGSFAYSQHRDEQRRDEQDNSGEAQYPFSGILQSKYQNMTES